MPTFTTSIKLFDAVEKDYETLQYELQIFAKQKNQSVVSKTMLNGETKYNWEGDVTIQKIAATIFVAAPKTNKKYSFSIVKNK